MRLFLLCHVFEGFKGGCGWGSGLFGLVWSAFIYIPCWDGFGMSIFFYVRKGGRYIGQEKRRRDRTGSIMSRSISILLSFLFLKTK